MIRLHDVAFSYDGQSTGRPTHVLTSVTVEAPAGRITVLAGPSGCGKSTLLNIAAGLDSPTYGRIERSAARTGYVFQNPALIPWLSARNNALFGATLHEVPVINAGLEVDRLFRRYGLDHVADAPPRALSGGMQQRLGLVRALVADPELLLLDEPFVHSDFVMRRRLLSDVASCVDSRGVAVLLATHDLHEAVLIADDILLLAGSPTRVVDRVTISLPRAERSEASMSDLSPYLERLWSAFEEPR